MKNTTCSTKGIFQINKNASDWQFIILADELEVSAIEAIHLEGRIGRIFLQVDRWDVCHARSVKPPVDNAGTNGPVFGRTLTTSAETTAP